MQQISTKRQGLHDLRPACWVQDGYLQDDHGIHHRVLNGVIETPTGQDCYGWLDVFQAQLVLQGVGALDSGIMQIAVGQPL